MAPTELDGRVAVVTGGGAGLGRAIGDELAAAGAAVVVADLDPAAGEEAAAALVAAGGRALAVAADVGDPAAVDRLVRRAVDAYGRLDIVCNNAGIVDTFAPPAELPVGVWERVLRVNLTGAFLVSRATLPHLLAAGGGSVVNIASVAGLRGGAAGAAYTAAKHGLIGLTRSLAYGYRDRGIRANAICPGGIATGIADRDEVDPAGLARLRPVLALAGGRRAAPAQVATVVRFLASPAASFINGAVLPVDDGWSAA